MLYQVGPLTCDTFPFEVGGAERDHSGDYAKHALIGTRQGYEPVGPGEDRVEPTGTLFPFHLGGLSEIETAHAIVDAQDPVFVMRADGGWAGWYVLLNVNEKHKSISPTGVGFQVAYSLKLERVDKPEAAVGGALMSVLSSIFG